MEDVVNIQEKLNILDSITHVEYRSYLPVNNNYSSGETIEIKITDSDKITCPSKSYLYFNLQIENKDGTPYVYKKTRLVTNFISFLFTEARYELGDKTIETINNLGLTSTIWAYTSLCKPRLEELQNAAFFLNDKELIDTVGENGKFSICVPLELWFGFCQDYDKIIYKMTQKLVLLRAHNDNDVFYNSDPVVDTGEYNIKINKIEWKMPQVNLSDTCLNQLEKTIDKNSRIPVEFRARDLVIRKDLKENTGETLDIKTCKAVERPRLIAYAFQTDRINRSTKDTAKFDHVKIKNIFTELNSIRYPYMGQRCEFHNNDYAQHYKDYLDIAPTPPIISKKNYKNNYTVYTRDLSRQEEKIKSSTIELKVTYETLDNIPPKTNLLTYIQYDKEFIYDPINNIVE